MVKPRTRASLISELSQQANIGPAIDHTNFGKFIVWTRSLPDDEAIAILKTAKEDFEREWRARINAKNQSGTVEREADPLHGISAIDALIGMQMSQRLRPRSGNKYLRYLADKAIGPVAEFGGGEAGAKRRNDAVGTLAASLKDALDHPRTTKPGSENIRPIRASRSKLTDGEFDDLMSLLFDPPDLEKHKLLIRLLQQAKDRLAALSAETN